MNAEVEAVVGQRDEGHVEAVLGAVSQGLRVRRALLHGVLLECLHLLEDHVRF